MAVYPSYAYHQTDNNPQPARIVLSAAELTALGSTWAVTPYPIEDDTDAPSDAGMEVLGERMEQLVVEARVQTVMMAEAFQSDDDPDDIRVDVRAFYSGLDA